MTPRTRALAESDVPLLLDLANAQGWEFDRVDAERMLLLGGGIVAESGEGETLGLLTLLSFHRLAWIGNVVVRPESRGQGVGGVLVQAALEEARSRRCETVGLYSVPPAVSLYERAGFRAYAEVVSYEGRGDPGLHPQEVHPLPAKRLPEVARFDERFSGDDRTRLLEALHEAYPESFLVLKQGGRVRGYAVAKPGERSSEIGPLVAEPGDLSAIATLADAALTLIEGPAEVGVPAMNFAAARHFEARGFKPAFSARAMYHGAPGHEADPFAVAATGGMEKG